MTVEDGVSLFQILLRLETLLVVGRLRVWQRQSKMYSERQTFWPPLRVSEIPELFFGQLVSQLESMSALDYESPGSD